MNKPIFSQEIKDKVKDLLINTCKVKNPTEADILESCQSLFYLGRTIVRYYFQKHKEFKDLLHKI